MLNFCYTPISNVPDTGCFTRSTSENASEEINKTNTLEGKAATGFSTHQGRVISHYNKNVQNALEGTEYIGVFHLIPIYSAKSLLRSVKDCLKKKKKKPFIGHIYIEDWIYCNVAFQAVHQCVIKLDWEVQKKNVNYSSGERSHTVGHCLDATEIFTQSLLPRLLYYSSLLYLYLLVTKIKFISP